MKFLDVFNISALNLYVASVKRNRELSLNILNSSKRDFFQDERLYNISLFYILKIF